MPSNLLAIDANFPTFSQDKPMEKQLLELSNYLFQLRESLLYSLQNLSSDNFNTVGLEHLTEETTRKLADQLEKIGSELTTISQEINTIKGRIARVDGLAGEIDDLKSRVVQTERDLQAVEQWSAEQERLTSNHEEKLLAAETELSELMKTASEQQQQTEYLTELAENVSADTAELSEEVSRQKQQTEDLTELVENASADTAELSEEVSRQQLQIENLTKLLDVLQMTEEGSVTVGNEEKELHLVGKIYINGILFEGGTS